MEVHHHQQQQEQQEQHYHLNVNPDPGGDGGGVGAAERDRFPQWSHAETKEFLAVRAELDRSFMETKRNKHLWAAVSSRMAEKGFQRTPDQCKCKWKNLVTRYKGSEAMEGETSRQFPFHEDMRRIFSERMERLLSLDEGKKQGVQVLSEDDDTNEAFESRKRRRVVGGGGASSSSSGVSRDQLDDTLREFMRWQTQMEAQRLLAWEAREEERREREAEWRRAMGALAAERAMMDSRWREGRRSGGRGRRPEPSGGTRSSPPS